MMTMNKFLLSLCCLALILCSASVEAQDFVQGLEPIGPVSSFTKSDTAVTFNCQDGSQVRISILAPDLIRVRASFSKSLPARDHSWAIARENWDAVRWNVKETAESVVISTDELEVVVRRLPLLIEFRDAKTGQIINADERPMMFDAKGTKSGMMFDPKAGMFVAAAKKLGFDEHFYGICEKAANLDMRRGYFVIWNSVTLE